MKWEALLAMVGLFALGMWLVVGPGAHVGMPDARAGATLHEVRVGDSRGALEVLVEGQTPTFRLLWRSGEASPVLSESEARAAMGGEPIDRALASPPSAVFRVLNITSWAGLVWVTLGLAGQVAFFGRMAVQWVVSERERRSVVPPMFWYLSLAGGVLLFMYFVWRQDIVGVMGQTTGVVIYARNVRLLYKQRSRERRRAMSDQASDSSAGAGDGDGSPSG